MRYLLRANKARGPLAKTAVVSNRDRRDRLCVPEIFTIYWHSSHSGDLIIIIKITCQRRHSKALGLQPSYGRTRGSSRSFLRTHAHLCVMQEKRVSIDD